MTRVNTLTKTLTLTQNLLLIGLFILIKFSLIVLFMFIQRSYTLTALNLYRTQGIFHIGISGLNVSVQLRTQIIF